MTKILNIDIILVGTTHPGNIGAVARAMGNMGLKNLILANPKANHLDEIAISRATGFVNILKKAKVYADLNLALSKYTKVYGFSARERNLNQKSMTVNLAAKNTVKDLVKDKHKIAYVFGPERTGLSNLDTDLCNVLVTIPMYKKASSLNIAAAVQIATYELLINQPSKITSQDKNIKFASKAEIAKFIAHAKEVLNDNYPVSHPGKLQLLIRKLNHLINHAQPQSSDIQMLRGILSHVQKTVAKNKKID